MRSSAPPTTPAGASCGADGSPRSGVGPSPLPGGWRPLGPRCRPRLGRGPRWRASDPSDASVLRPRAPPSASRVGRRARSRRRRSPRGAVRDGDRRETGIVDRISQRTSRRPHELGKEIPAHVCVAHHLDSRVRPLLYPPAGPENAIGAQSRPVTEMIPSRQASRPGDGMGMTACVGAGPQRRHRHHRARPARCPRIIGGSWLKACDQRGTRAQPCGLHRAIAVTLPINSHIGDARSSYPNSLMKPATATTGDT